MADLRLLDLGAVMGLGSPVYRAFREGDEAAILRTLGELCGIDYSLDEWAWRFPPLDGGRLIVVGEEDGGIAAVCAGTPAQLAGKDREWAAVELHQVATSGDDDSRSIIESFVDILGSGGRFDAMIASSSLGLRPDCGFVHATRARSVVFSRHLPPKAPLRRLLYRAERARDWEPRLDGLWRRARRSYPVAVVRNADYALRRFAAHPTVRYHRFIVLPRFSNQAVAFAVFAANGATCRWVDLVWDHDHPGGFELLAHISGRLVAQIGAKSEELPLAGDDQAVALLTKRGFTSADPPDPPAIAVRSLNPELDAAAISERIYVTPADPIGLDP